MVTASHNPEPVSLMMLYDVRMSIAEFPLKDNGVKLVDPSGEMLDPAWELHATALANCPTTESLLSTFATLISHLRVDMHQPASIVYARDTRPSGPDLIQALEAGLKVFGTSVKTIDIGVTTTPILHYVVKATNDKSGSYGKPTVEGYMEKTACAFKTLVVSGIPYSFYVTSAKRIIRATKVHSLPYMSTVRMELVPPPSRRSPNTSATSYLSILSTQPQLPLGPSIRNAARTS